MNKKILGGLLALSTALAISGGAFAASTVYTVTAGGVYDPITATVPAGSDATSTVYLQAEALGATGSGLTIMSGQSADVSSNVKILGVTGDSGLNVSLSSASITKNANGQALLQLALDVADAGAGTGYHNIMLLLQGPDGTQAQVPLNVYVG